MVLHLVVEPQFHQRLQNFFDAIGLHLTVGYGLTETTATLSLFPFTNYKYGTCGKILPGVEIRIGAENEIQARGSGIMKGYFNKPEETKSCFTGRWLVQNW